MAPVDLSGKAQGKGSKGKGKGKSKEERSEESKVLKKEGSDKWVPKRKQGPAARGGREYELRGWRLERCKGFEDSIDKVLKNTDVKPKDFDELLLLFLEVMHRRGKAVAALEDLETRLKDVKRSDVHWWTRYMYGILRKFDHASYVALQSTPEYKKYKAASREDGRHGGEGPIAPSIPEDSYPLNKAATEFIPLHPATWHMAMGAEEYTATDNDKEDKTNLDANAPEFRPDQALETEPSHPLLPQKQPMNKHATKFVPSDAAPPFPESWAAAIGEGKLEVDSEGQCICPFESSVLPDVVQLRIGVEDVRLQPPLANAPWNDAPGLVGKDFKCGVVLSEADTSPPKNECGKNSVVLVRHLLKSKEEKVYLSDIAQKCAEAGVLGVLVESSLGQPGHILKEGQTEPGIPCVAISGHDYAKLQAALLAHKNSSVWMRSGRAAELKHRWIRESLIPCIASNDEKLKQVNLPSKRRGKGNCDFALTDGIVDEILDALKGNTVVKSMSLISPGLSPQAIEKVAVWNAAKTTS